MTNTAITFSELLKSISGAVLLAFTAQAPAAAEYNKVARWLNQVFMAELARRAGDAPREVGPLLLAEDELEFGIEWLDFCSNSYTDAGLNRGDPNLLRLALLVDHIHQQVRKTLQATIH